MNKTYAMVLSASMLATGCGRESAPVTPTKEDLSAKRVTVSEPETIELQGAGATFPYPIYSKWIAEYQKEDPRVRINYQSIGSGGGIRQITARTVDFGATDAVMSDGDLAKAPGELLHIPTTLGAVAVTYNIPGVTALKFSPEVLGQVFLGEIKSWNDHRLVKLNPEAKLRNQPITVVFRSDGSGTTSIFTEYMAKVSASWKDKVGAGKSVKFPTGLGAKGNEGVAGQIRTNPGSIGYVELAYAKQTGLTYASIQNSSGTFVEPGLEAITAAAASAANSISDDLRVSIVDPAGKDAYPISAFTYILVYQDQADSHKAKALARFLWWAIHEGQTYGPPLHYATLPAELVTKIESKLRSLRSKGEVLLNK